MVAVIALAAAVCYAVATVLQHHSAEQADPSASLRPGLLLRLLRDPRWILGVGANGLGFLLRFAALGRGSLVLVQPLLVSGLLFALPLGAVLSRRTMHRREWLGASAVSVGLSAFLVAAAPTRGRTSAPLGTWLGLVGAVAVPVAVLVLLASRRTGGPRAALLAGAGGILLAPTAALMKVSATLLGTGLGRFVTGWAPYTMLAVGVVAMIVVQSAYQAAPLAASLPVLSVAEPLASVAVGAWLFHERVGRAAFAVPVEVVALAVMAVGIAVVAGSPVVSGVAVADAA